MRPKICLCIMAKHESATIEKAIESCREYVDHVLVSVDSKSSDGTYEIAQRIADTVIRHDFEDPDSPHGSFSRIRNLYMKAAMNVGCDWVVHLDGHEYVNISGKETFHTLISDNPMAEAFYINLDMNGTMIRQVRLSKLRDDIKYTGDIHNYLSGYKQEGSAKNIVFVHDRTGQPQEHVQERNEQRTRMSEEILGQKVKDNPKDTRSMFYLAQSYKETGKLEKAIETFYKYLEVSVFVPERWNARDYLYHCLKCAGRKEEGLEVIRESLQELPQRAEAWLILGDHEYNEVKDFAKAIEYYEMATKTPRPSSIVFINESAYTWFSHDKLSMAYHNNGQPLEAIRSAGMALQGNPPEAHAKRIGVNIVFWADNLKEKMK